MPFKDPDKRKEYMKKYRKDYYQKNKQNCLIKNKKRKKKINDWFNVYKSTVSCYFCGESNPACLDFHHLDPSTKKSSISNMVTDGYSISKIKKEIEKCLVICSNGHRKLHYEKQLLGLK